MRSGFATGRAFHTIVVLILVAAAGYITADDYSLFDAFSYFSGFRDAVDAGARLSFRMESSPLFFFPIGKIAALLNLSPFTLARVLNVLLAVPAFLVAWAIGARVFSRAMSVVAFSYFAVFAPGAIAGFTGFYYDAAFNLLQMLLLLAGLALWQATDARSYRRALVLGALVGAASALVRGQGLALVAAFPLLVVVEGLVHRRGRVASIALAVLAFGVMLAPTVAWKAATRAVAASPSAFEIGYLDGYNRLFRLSRYAYDVDRQIMIYRAPPLDQPYGPAALIRKALHGAVAVLSRQVAAPFLSTGVTEPVKELTGKGKRYDLLYLPIVLLGLWRLWRTRVSSAGRAASSYLLVCLVLFAPMWIGETFIQVRASYYTSALLLIGALWVLGLEQAQDLLRRLAAARPGISPLAAAVFPLAIVLVALGGILSSIPPTLAGKQDYAVVAARLPATGPAGLLVPPPAQEAFAQPIIPFVEEFLRLSDADTARLLRDTRFAVIPVALSARLVERIRAAGGTVAESDIKAPGLKVYAVSFAPRP